MKIKIRTSFLSIATDLWNSSPRPSPKNTMSGFMIPGCSGVTTFDIDGVDSLWFPKKENITYENRYNINNT